MVGIFENVGESFKFGFRNCYGDGIKGFLRMLALLITLCIPIVCFIPMGIFLKVFRGEKPDFTGAGKSFIRGLLSFVITLIYMLIPIILFAIFGGLALIPAMTGGDMGQMGAVLLGSIGFIVAIIAAVILGFVAIPALVNFARNGFGGAFRFSQIFGMISKAGFGKYILSYIVLIIITLIICLILSLIGVIPVVGIIVLILVTIPLGLFEYRFWANLFAA